jgi:hypothetical protein
MGKRHFAEIGLVSSKDLLRERLSGFNCAPALNDRLVNNHNWSPPESCLLCRRVKDSDLAIVLAI